MQFYGLFTLRKPVSQQVSSFLVVFGIVFMLLVWYPIVKLGFISEGLLPSPVSVFNSYQDLLNRDGLIPNTIYSFKLNVLGYLEAVAISIPLGFVIGLFPLFREMFRTPLEALRFLPMTALIGCFIAWFGIYENMKVQFLAMSIVVYLLPVVVQRIQEVSEIYVQTVHTLSTSRWNIIQKVFIPDVLSKVFDDIRVLVAISWTYIIVAEGVNNSGGVGAMCYIAGRQSRIDKVFAILLVIILVGYVQDKLFMFFDKLLFPFKYEGDHDEN
jgi:NitT/TauT family transport system permease protein